MEDDKSNISIQTYVVPPSPIVAQSHVPLVVSNVGGNAVFGKLVSAVNGLPGIQSTNQTVTVLPVTGTQQIPTLDPTGVAEPMPYGGSGVIYALSQYSPFISIPRYQNSALSSNQPQIEDESSNHAIGDGDVHSITTSTSNISPSVQEQTVCNEPGKCQAGGEVRLSYLADKLASINLPDGFVLVGAKSPMLIGMTLVAAVDKRYLPSEGNSVAMLGFSGNCIGCGATGFRYFTEFSTHINLKLATQPKKQKHLKYYILKDKDGKWTKGALIPWKGTETRKRNLPMYNMAATSVGRTPELVTPYTMQSSKENAMPMLLTSQQVMLQPTSFPAAKKQRFGLDLNIDIASDSNAAVMTTSAVGPAKTSYGLMPVTSPKPDTDIFLTFKKPISSICGVRPVLLLCQNNNFKLPNNVNDIIISDLLHGCFDSPSSGDSCPISTESTYVNKGSIMATGSLMKSQDIDSKQPHSHMEQNAASTLISMGSNTNTVSTTAGSVPSMTAATATNRPQSLQVQNAAGSSATYQAAVESSSQKLPHVASILVLIQYLAALEEYNNISREEIEGLLQRARLDMSSSRSQVVLSQLGNVSLGQLPVIANLLASSSKGRVKVITSSFSFQNGIFKALRWVHDTFAQTKSGKVKNIPNFIVILSTPNQGPPEFCVLVTGITHAKLLAESLGLQGIVNSPFAKDIEKLKYHFHQTEHALNSQLATFKKTTGAQCFYPFSAPVVGRITNSDASIFIPTQAPTATLQSSSQAIFANQSSMAQQLLTQLCTIADDTDVLELPSFARVELLIVVPHNMSLYRQTIKRLSESGILFDLGLETEENAMDYKTGEKYVITYSDWQMSINKWDMFVKRAVKQTHTLFVLIFDQCQNYCLPQGMPDVLPNLKEVFESTNVIPLFVTAVPFMFQTRQSFIDPDNEVFWTDARKIAGNSSNLLDDKCVKVNDLDMLYFGIKEYTHSTRWYQQYPLIRHEETFDRIVTRASRINDTPYSIVDGFLIVRLYRAAIMVAGGIKTAEQYCVLSFLQVIRDIVETPLKNHDGSGYMLLIRVPNVDLGRYCYDTLKETRNSVGFQYRFDVIFDDGENDFELDEHFLNRMRAWRTINGDTNSDSWHPRCLEELLDLSCILIYAGKDRTGQTFPRSLKYCDLRLVDNGNFYRSVLETEIGSVACYLTVNESGNPTMVNKHVVTNSVRSSVGTTYLDEPLIKAEPEDLSIQNKPTQSVELPITSDTQVEDHNSRFSSKYPLPIVFVSKTVWQIIHSNGGQSGGQPRLINLNSDPNTRWIDSNRPTLVKSNPAHQSRYYRRCTIARQARKLLTTPGTSSPPSPNSTGGNVYLSETANDDDSDEDDNDKEQFHPRCLLLSGPPQVGKTGAYLHFARLLHSMLMRLKRVDVYDNRVSYAPALDPMEICGIVALHHPQWPDITKVSETEFITEFLDSEFKSFSRVHISSVSKDSKPDKKQEIQMLKRTSDIKDIGGQQIVPVILANCASHDTLHHCDSCKFYREGMGGDTTKVLDYQLLGFGDENAEVDIQFIIPVMHMKYFTIDEEQQAVKGLLMPKINVGTPFPKIVKTDEETLLGRKIKTPILMASSEGQEEGLLNLFHAMEETDHIHITFVKQSEMAIYQKNWPNHVFAILPQEFDEASFGAVKQVMKLFARQNYEFEVQRQNVDSDKDEDIWPLILIMSDNVVMWQQAGKDNEPIGDNEDDSGSMDADALLPSADTTPLFDIMKLVEATPHVLHYGIIGLRPWSSSQFDVPMHGFIRTFIHSCIFLNVKQTQNVSFSNTKYIGENIDFQLCLVENNILTCRFEHLSFMCKLTARSGWRVPLRTQSWEQSDPTEEGNSFAHLVAPPDREELKTISAPPHLVMQRYLGLGGNILFPASVGKADHPVLVIGGYTDLGRDISVCVINADTNGELNVATSHQMDKVYGGLLLYDYPACLNKEFLSKFSFIDDAKLCIVSNDRYTMREEIARLDLEENWRFRFRDEYQTATTCDGNKKPVFFLTGVIG
eukprot:gene4602-5207_t